MIFILLSAASYYLFNAALFSLYDMYTGVRQSRALTYIATFALNFGAFILFSYMELPLALNWSIFALLLVGETLFIYRQGLLSGLYLGIGGCLAGLAATDFARSLVAICLRLPFWQFDARFHAAADGNLKFYPIVLGFMLAAILFTAVRRMLERRPDWRITDWQSLRFMIGLSVVLFAYLTLNLLIYSISVNSLPLKLWSVKTALCALASYAIGSYYTVQEVRLAVLTRKSQSVRSQLETHRQQEAELAQAAYTDALTGCPNRAYGDHWIAQADARGERVTVCFVDLDGLKGVNDTCGHLMGDKYICAVAHALQEQLRGNGDTLFRYGGDEFVLLYQGEDEADAQARLSEVERTLQEISYTSEYPFALSLSAGISAGSPVRQALKLADEQMYVRKEAARRQGAER